MRGLVSGVEFFECDLRYGKIGCAMQRQAGLAEFDKSTQGKSPARAARRDPEHGSACRQFLKQKCGRKITVTTSHSGRPRKAGRGPTKVMLSASEDLKTEIEDRAKELGFKSTADYLHSLVQRDLDRRRRAARARRRAAETTTQVQEAKLAS